MPDKAPPTSFWPGLAAVAAVTIYLIAFLDVERPAIVITLLAGGIAAVVAAAWSGAAAAVGHSFVDHEDRLGLCAVLGLFALAVVFHEDHFVLLLVTTVLLYSVACLGLNIQFGYAGVMNFAGASFFGIGAYTSAVLNNTAVPHLLVLLIGGLLAALIGSVLLLPVLRTRGHYAALVTIAFELLFKTFLEVN